MDEQILEQEREQLISCWSAIDRAVLLKKIRRIIAEDATPRRRHLIRELHNELGFRAEQRGRKNTQLCAGSIFRTEQFIRTEKRIGNKNGRTVHIEHTVPICVLDGQFQSIPGQIDEKGALEWFFKHSVATAFHVNEVQHLRGVHRNTNAFLPESPDHQKPFLRYRALFQNRATVWNVLDGSKIDPEQFTFDDHYSIIRNILQRVGG